MILCFSGTGNSRYIARRIAGELGGDNKIIDLNKKIKAGDTAPIKTDKDIILVVPTYAWRIPRVVSEWIAQTEFTGAQRIWFVMNCGSEIGNAADFNKRIAESKGLRYMGTAQIIMPENYIAMFNAPQSDEAKEIVKAAEPAIEQVIKCIKEGREFDAPRRNIYDRFMSKSVNPIFYKLIVKSKAFSADENCTGCGQCVELCPMNNIKLVSSSADAEERLVLKPAWGTACTHCMACICYCPAEAIEYGKKSEGKPRYNFEMLDY